MVFPERCDRGTVSYLEGERVPKNKGVVTKIIRNLIYELYSQKWGYEGTGVWGYYAYLFLEEV